MNKCKHETYHKFFSNLANPLKVDIILLLREKEKSVSELTSSIRGEQSKISHALSALKKCNIVQSRPKAKQRIYSLNKRTILPMLKLIDKHASTQCNCCPWRER